MAYMPQSYYQNNFSNYPYYGQQYGYLQQQNQQIQQQPIQQSPLQLNGKVVENSDIAKISEVPIGSYGIFPKADMTEIYVKNWNPDGSTNFRTYIPVLSDESEKEENDFCVAAKQIQESILSLSKKVDQLRKESSPVQTKRTTKKGDDVDE